MVHNERALLQRPFFMAKPYKIPESVLVVIYTKELDVLLIRRADGDDLGAEYWQSVTGSKDRPDEDLMQTAVREVWEETGIDCNAEATQSAVLRDWKLVNVYGIYPNGCIDMRLVSRTIRSTCLACGWQTGAQCV